MSECTCLKDAEVCCPLHIERTASEKYRMRIAELKQENARLREAAAEWKSWHEAVCISLRDSDHNNKDAMREAVSLATWLYDRYFLTDGSEFVLCDTTAGVISQIDNMVAGLLYDKEKLKQENARLCEAAMKHIDASRRAARYWTDSLAGYVTHERIEFDESTDAFEAALEDSSDE